MYKLLTGNSLFGSRKLSEVYIDLNKKCDVNLKRDLKHLSRDAVDLCGKLLFKDPTKRISVRRALKHRWFLPY